MKICLFSIIFLEISKKLFSIIFLIDPIMNKDKRNKGKFKKPTRGVRQVIESEEDFIRSENVFLDKLAYFIQIDSNISPTGEWGRW